MPPPAPPPPSSAPALLEPRDEETVGLFRDFLAETEEGLGKAEEILTAHQSAPAEGEAVAALFRVFHSIKGFAGALAVSDAVALAHATESLLNPVREGKRRLDSAVVDRVFESCALMREMLAATQASVDAGTALSPTPKLAAQLERLRLDAVPRAPPVSAPAPAGPLAVEAAPAQPRLKGTMKVDVERVDTLVEMIGELLVVESMVAHAPEAIGAVSRPFRNNLSQLDKISRDLQGLAMRLRMVPVRWAFQKMNRIVHDVSRSVGKDVVLVKEGESTELDRSMVEHLEEPLVHLLRNCIDHGVESAAERVAAGKPAQATLRLRAFHEGGHVVIEVEDDGRGIQKDLVLRKAIERGLVSADAALSEAQIFNLIFAAGFSTAAKVSELSGRGVGMDVVKRNIEALRGRVTVSSTPGKGTKMKLVLPLTLAVIKGMLVGCGAERYIVPSLAIVESLKPRRSMFVTVGRRQTQLELRGELMPLLRLDELFRTPGERPALEDGLAVVVAASERKLALWVHEVITEQQLVIKPVDPESTDQDLFSGAAILADGRVSLIVDVDRVARAPSPAGRRPAVSISQEATR